MNNISNQKNFNTSVSHPLQSFEWGEFRKKTGVNVIRKCIANKKINACFQLTIHKIPHTPWNIGYLPKGDLPTKELLEALTEIGKTQNCIFIQIEPNIEKLSTLSPRGEAGNSQPSTLKLIPATHPLFTKYTFVLDLTKSEEEILMAMHPKTRYNIKVAQKHGVKIIQDNSEQAFEEYLKLAQETTTRQKFYAHTELYHRQMWKTLRISNLIQSDSNFQSLSAHLLVALYKETTLAAWILFVFKDTLYYPYGASSSKHRETMASNLMMWEAIRFGKKLGLKKFDTWGALGPNPDKDDPWYGFHRFKQGYGGKLVEFVGSFDLVINPSLYQLYKAADWIRWIFLKLKK